MNFSEIVKIGFFFTIIPYLYFLNRFYIPRYDRKITFFLCGICLMIMIKIDMIIYSNTIGRPFVALFFLYTIILVFYKGAFLRILIGPIIIIPAGIICELPFDMITIAVLQVDMFSIVQNDWFVIVQALVSTVLTVEFHYIVNLFNKLSSMTSKHIYVILAMVFSFFSSVLMVSQIYMLSASVYSLEHHFVFIILMLSVSLISQLLLLNYINKSYNRVKAEYSLKKLEAEYQILLRKYIRTNDEIYSYLRHDIMNIIIRKNERECAK